MNYWKPNAALYEAFKRYVIEFRNGPIPVLVYLQTANHGEFDAYTALLRVTDETPIGHADFVEVRVPAGHPFGRPYRKRVLGFEVGPVGWSRASANVYRTVFIPEMKLSSGKIISAHRVSKPFGDTGFDVKKKDLEQQNKQLLSWAAPFIKAALGAERFHEQMIDEDRRVAEGVDRLPQQMTRAKYEEACKRLSIVPMRDNEIFGVRGGDPYFSNFPYVPVEASIGNSAHQYRQMTLSREAMAKIEEEHNVLKRK